MGLRYGQIHPPHIRLVVYPQAFQDLLIAYLIVTPVVLWKKGKLTLVSLPPKQEQEVDMAVSCQVPGLYFLHIYIALNADEYRDRIVICRRSPIAEPARFAASLLGTGRLRDVVTLR